jgi:hydrogenase nickel incorporation protein HypB
MTTLLWLECGACSGESMAILGADGPGREGDNLLDFLERHYVQLLWHPSLSLEPPKALAGIMVWILADELELTLLCLEGSIIHGPHGTGIFDTFEGQPKRDIIRALCHKADYVLAMGTCAAFGGLPAAPSNPTESTGLQFTHEQPGGLVGPEWRSKAGLPVVNLAGCPVDAATITHHELTGPPLRAPKRGRRVMQLEHDLLRKNNQLAESNRQSLSARRVLALNLVSSPGVGKTTLLVRTIQDPKSCVPIAVIEGDQQTSHDAQQVAAAGAQAIQINTGKGCHLDAQMVGQALGKLALKPESLLFIENVGNLVCPADFDLGEARRVVILSVVEGEDKPLKYPGIFASADLMLLTKMDLLPYVSWDEQRCITHAKRMNPALEVISLSATSGAGLRPWYDWIDQQRIVVSSGRSPAKLW